MAYYHGDDRWDDDANLLEETLMVLADHGKMPADVNWIGEADGSVAVLWDAFASLADRDYDSGFGCIYVSLSLVVVGADWWLERYEYDGSERWEYKTMPHLVEHARHAGLRVWPEDMLGGVL